MSKILHRTWSIPEDESALLALVEHLRKASLLGEGNPHGAPDELLKLSGGPNSELASCSLLMGPANIRFIVRQPDRRMLSAPENETENAVLGEPNLTYTAPPMRIEIERWSQQGWKHESTHMGVDLAEAFRTLDARLPTLPAEYPDLPALPGCLAGALAYDLLQWTQPLAMKHLPEEDAPLAVLWLAERWLIHDRPASTLHLLNLHGDEWADEVSILLDGDWDTTPSPTSNSPPVSSEVSSHTDQEHMEMVESVRKAITAGNLYQLNFGRRWMGPLLDHPWQIMRRLASENPAPFSAYLHAPSLGMSLVSSSPELLLATSGGIARTRPIKGTRPRGNDPIEEEALRQALLSCEKEMAEHRMLVDLERNDLGMFCQAGSVEHCQFQVEAYSQVQHLVSEVRGRLQRDCDVWDALQAMFPGGSITGCPKTVTCAGIDILEQHPRSFWTGSIGHVDPRTGRSAWNILIRTMEAKRNDIGDWNATVQAGGGLVIGSVPAAEVEEAKWKAAALRQAAGWLSAPTNLRGEDDDDSDSPPPSGDLTIHPLQVKRAPLASATKAGEMRRWVPESKAILRGSITGNSRRILFVDNLDSFTWNIIHACAGIGADVTHVCGLTTGIDQLETVLADVQPTHIILGPGPGRPTNSPLSTHLARLGLERELCDKRGRSIPLLGICLGHQAIGEAAGMELIESPLGPVHGTPCNREHDGSGVFTAQPSPLKMARYNSLVLLPADECNPSGIQVSAWDESGTLPMGLTHPTLPVYGVQFHPESCGSQSGISLLANFLQVDFESQPWLAHD